MADELPTIQRIAMKALIVNDEGKVLVLREADTYDEGVHGGRYELPGGRLNVGEPFLEGLAREVMEETGLEIAVVKPLYVGEWFPVIKGVPNQIVGVYFQCRALSTEVRLSEEHDEYQWIDPKKAPEFKLLSPDDKVVETFPQSR